MHLSTLSEWLTWIASVHSTEMELGLDRVKEVAGRLHVLSPTCLVIIVGGTNGKGSTVAGLESIYRAMGYRVGAFTTPFLFKHNEQVRINGELATDDEFCRAFEKVEVARGNVTLTPFEYGTLAALIIFQQATLDVMLLEVGLGGRLDATNIIDADLSVVTSIGIDHVAWLGATRELIAYEKAAIFRPGKLAVCGDFDPPSTLIDYAAKISTGIFYQGKDFNYQQYPDHWDWRSGAVHYDDLPINALALQNMSTVLMTITLLQTRLPVTPAAIHQGLSQVTLPGRIQIVPGAVTEIYDVSHNPAAVAMLAKQLSSIPCTGKTYAVFSMLGDKDIRGSITNISACIDKWFVAPLLAQRGASAEKLQEAFREAQIQAMTMSASIEEAYELAKRQTKAGDRLIIFGSFHTIADVWTHKEKN